MTKTDTSCACIPAVVNRQELWLCAMHVFSDEAKFHVSRCFMWHNRVILGSEPHREHLEHEWDSPKWTCGILWHTEMLSAFFSLIWTSLQAIYFWTSLENWALHYSSTAAPTFLLFRLYSVLRSFCSHYPWLFECEFLIGWVERGWPTVCHPPILMISWLWIFSLRLCERLGIQPTSECTEWTQSTGHYSNCKCYKRHVKMCPAVGGL